MKLDELKQLYANPEGKHNAHEDRTEALLQEIVDLLTQIRDK